MGALVIQGIPPELMKREALEEHIERMIALLDALDGDSDPEEVDEDADPLDRGESDTVDDEPDSDGEPDDGV